jgi:hypothetical protein
MKPRPLAGEPACRKARLDAAIGFSASNVAGKLALKQSPRKISLEAVT